MKLLELHRRNRLEFFRIVRDLIVVGWNTLFGIGALLGMGGIVPAGFRDRDESGVGQFPADRDCRGVELFRAQIFFIPAEAGA